MKNLISEIAAEIRYNKEFTFCMAFAVVMVTVIIINAINIGL